jgi:hypothetical protein
VTWAEPRRLEQRAETVRSLHVSNLPAEGAGEDAIRELFAPFGKVGGMAGWQAQLEQPLRTHRP